MLPAGSMRVGEVTTLCETPGRLEDCASEWRARSLSNFGRVPSLPFRVSVMACPSAVVPRRVVA